MLICILDGEWELVFLLVVCKFGENEIMTGGIKIKCEEFI